MWTETNTEAQLIKGIIKHGPDILEHCLCSDDLTKYIDRIYNEHLNYPIPPATIHTNKWFIPDDYCPDLNAMLYDMCETEEQKERVNL